MTALKVLVVDADAFEGALTVEQLRNDTGEFLPVLVSNCAKLDEAISSEQPAAVVWDLDCLDSDLQVVQEFQRRHPDVAFVIYCARIDDGAVLRAIECGAQDVMIKGDVQPEQLRLGLLCAVTRHSRDRRRLQALAQILDTITGGRPLTDIEGNSADGAVSIHQVRHDEDK